ncbi:MAG: hypothetical protein H0T48_09140 [Gemmatimonadaceae bacterium]|nr:hypothetical protein [Gemmatimonadaceae bacterium]
MRKTGVLAVIGFCLACGSDEQSNQSTGGGVPLSIGPGLFTTPAADPAVVQLQMDSARAGWAIVSNSGGNVTATAADGTQFTLTIPQGALVSDEQITVTPVTSIAGLPGGATVVAGAQLEPDGLLLLEPATLEIKPPSPVSAAQAFPIAWDASGNDLHLHPVMPRSAVTAFQVNHFSGFAIASGSDAAMSAIDAKIPQACANRVFRELNKAFAARRRAALMGDESGIADLAARFIELARSYLNNILKPVIAQLEKDDSLLPCVMSEVVAFERTVQLMMGEAGAPADFAEPLENAWVEVYKALGDSFNRTYERCMRNESPVFQLQKMTSAARLLVIVNLPELLPGDHVSKIQECGKRIEYRVSVESKIENVYAEQGRGSFFSSSRTEFRTGMLKVVWDEKQSQPGAPKFTSEKVALDVSVSAVPRGSCRNQVRVQPGSTIAATVIPILNPRIGRLVCGGGKARCEQTDVNPGVMVTIAPHVVEEIFVNTGTSCTPSTEWNEWMMMWEGSQSTGAFEPFQVRGTGRAVVARRGGRRRGYLDLPAIQSAASTVTASVEAARK